MLSRVSAKHIGDVFLRHSVYFGKRKYNMHCYSKIDRPTLTST